VQPTLSTCRRFRRQRSRASRCLPHMHWRSTCDTLTCIARPTGLRSKCIAYGDCHDCNRDTGKPDWRDNAGHLQGRCRALSIRQAHNRLPRMWAVPLKVRSRRAHHHLPEITFLRRREDRRRCADAGLPKLRGDPVPRPLHRGQMARLPRARGAQPLSHQHRRTQITRAKHSVTLYSGARWPSATKRW